MKINEHAVLPKEIFVISPFKRGGCYDIFKALRRRNLKDISVGTVYISRKRSKVVYLVLGADENSRGGATFWAVSTPNIMNVALLQGRGRKYIIGSQKL